MRIPVLAALAIGMAAMAAAQTAPNWDYRGPYGPINWSKLDPSYKACSDGHRQSPINIRKARLNKALKPLDLHFIAGPVTLENDGHMITVHTGNGSYLVNGGVRYELQRIDFHRPSETAVNGKLADLSLGMFFKSADGKMAILAVRMNADRDVTNPTLANLWTKLPAAPGTSEKITDIMVNPGGLLPVDPGYWTYMGSLTTPPCTEGVKWFVMEKVVDISREQLGSYTSIYKMNSRPLQSTHGRRIEANK